MRGLIISISILVVFVIISFIYVSYISSVSNSIAQVVTDVENDVINDNKIDDIAKNIDVIDNMWKKNSVWIAIFVSHNEMEEIKYIIERMKAYGQLGEKNMILADSAELKERIKHLVYMEDITFENLL